MEKQTPAGPAAATKHAPDLTPVPPPLPLFDDAEFDRLQSEIGTGGIRRLLDVYTLDLERRMVRMEHAFAQHDFTTLAVECHALRAATAAIGLARFASELGLLETSAKDMAIARSDSADERIESKVRHRHLHVVLEETRPYLTKLSRAFKGEAV